VIIKTQHEVTAAVLSELQRSEDPRFKQIMTAAVQHLHAFVRDARLTEMEFTRLAR
jgi:hydroxyquinol 1,2-dioxygenase